MQMGVIVIKTLELALRLLFPVLSTVLRFNDERNPSGAQEVFPEVEVVACLEWMMQMLLQATKITWLNRHIEEHHRQNDRFHRHRNSENVVAVLFITQSDK